MDIFHSKHKSKYFDHRNKEVNNAYIQYVPSPSISQTAKWDVGISSLGYLTTAQGKAQGY